MRILITGHAGFIGKSLVRKLIKDGHEVIGLDLHRTDELDIEQIEFDITNESIIDLSIWKKIDVCYHLAAMANVDDVRVFRGKAFKVNLFGTFNICEACRRNNVLLVFISTACVYGNTPQHPSTEDGPTYPMDLYGVTKLAGEEIVKLLSRWIILRFGTTIGPEQRSALATWIFLNQAKNDEPMTITGDGKQSRNWIYIDDLIRGCSLVVERGVENEIINLVGEKSYTVNQMAKIAAEVVRGKGYTCKIKFLPPREGDVMKEDISIEKAKRLLGWKPKINLRKALKLSYKKGTSQRS